MHKNKEILRQLQKYDRKSYKLKMKNKSFVIFITKNWNLQINKDNERLPKGNGSLKLKSKQAGNTNE